jgi:glycerol-3-phosphate dehydrogenase (NAD(P)+)
MRITVLGAGYMGSAMAQVASMCGHDVRLWGTWLDDTLLDAVERNEPHPRLGIALDSRVTPVRSAHLEAALEGASLIVHAVSSEGAVAVMNTVAAHLPEVPILSVTKGFLRGAKGTMGRIDEVLQEVAGRKLRFVHASGPAKAVEVARSVLTHMSFAGADADARFCREALLASHMRIEITSDIQGAEIASALKNAYATGLGLWDGFLGADCHNARAACFSQSVREMVKLVEAGGGHAATVYGAAGVGDLHVTAAAGRNRAFGEGVGKGVPASEVAARMREAGNLTEGYPAIATAWTWAKEHGVTNLPWLEALHAIVWENAAVQPTLATLRLFAG